MMGNNGLLLAGNEQAVRPEMGESKQHDDNSGSPPSHVTSWKTILTNQMLALMVSWLIGYLPQMQGG